MNLGDLVDIIIPKPYKKSKVGEEVLVLNQTHFARAGFTRACGNIKMIPDKNYLKNELKEFDVLLSKHGTPFKVAVVGQLTQHVLANSTLYILRIKTTENIEHMAQNLYMYLKSNKGQDELTKIAKGLSSSISKKNLLELDIPICNEKSKISDTKTQISENFWREEKLYNDSDEAFIAIHHIQDHFNDKNKIKDLGTCVMCKNAPATQLRLDTWKPYNKELPMCDKCSSNIMF